MPPHRTLSGPAANPSYPPGKGTTFKVLLPVAHQIRHVPSDHRHADTRADLGETGTVLIVDDEEGVRTATGWALISSGFTIVTAPDGQTAVELFAERSNEIAVVLLDMTMPGMSSGETLKELQRTCSDVPVISCSGYSQENVAGRFAGRGAAGFLQKPYELETLLGKVRDAIGSRSLSGPDRGSDRWLRVSDHREDLVRSQNSPEASIEVFE